MFRKLRRLFTSLGLAGSALMLLVGTEGGLQAATILSSGARTAVSSMDASADFDSADALFDNPYVEDGIEFYVAGARLTAMVAVSWDV